MSEASQCFVEPRLPELQPRIVIGRPPSATSYGKHLFRSATPPCAPPASRRMSGFPELLLLSGSTSSSPYGWSNDATTQRSNDLAAQPKGHLLRTSIESSCEYARPPLQILRCSAGYLPQAPWVEGLGVERLPVARRRSIDVPPAWGATANRQPTACLQHLNSRIIFAASCPAPTQPTDGPSADLQTFEPHSNG